MTDWPEEPDTPVAGTSTRERIAAAQLLHDRLPDVDERLNVARMLGLLS